MTIPPAFLHAAAAHAREAGRDFTAQPLNDVERRDLGALYLLDRTVEQAGEYLTTGRVRARVAGEVAG